jgi:methylmalonyl-CoA epimerase
MEIADVFAINKADLAGADRLEQEVRAMQSLGSPAERANAAPLRRVIAADGAGVSELLDVIRMQFEKRGQRGARTETWDLRLREILHDRLMASLPDEQVSQHADRVATRTEDPYTAVEGARLYEGVLGMQDTGRETVAAERVHVAMLPAGGGAHPPRIELLEATGPDSSIAKFIEKRGPGLHHIALRVDDLAHAVERLRGAGARLLNEPRAGADGHTYVFVHPSSAGGVLLELIQK